MTWTKLGDEYGDQGWKLSDAAFRLHTEALVWSNRKHLDGRLNKDEIRLWAKRPEAAAELVRQGFWTDEDDHYLIVAHLGWQRTAAEWLHQSEVNRANQAKRKPRRGKHPGPLLNESLNESPNESLNERDWSGLDGTGRTLLGKAVDFSATEASASAVSQCRYCDTELPEHMASQRSRGYCSRRSCITEAKAELAEGQQ